MSDLCAVTVFYSLQLHKGSLKQAYIKCSKIIDSYFSTIIGDVQKVEDFCSIEAGKIITFILIRYLYIVKKLFILHFLNFFLFLPFSQIYITLYAIRYSYNYN